MSDSGNVRLVRCPKCQNLLPELADYSVYQCGGCGAVLRAKGGSVDADTLSEKSDDERVEGVYSKADERGISEKSDDSFDNGKANIDDASEMDVKANGGSTKVENKEALSNGGGGRPTIPEKHKDVPKVSTKVLVDEYEPERKQVRDKMSRYKESNVHIGTTSDSERSGQVPNPKIGERVATDGFRRNIRKGVDDVRISASNYPEEGPSNYFSDSNYGGYGEAFKNHYNVPDGPKRVAYLEQDRAELLRKLDELKDQLSRSCNVVNKPKEKILVDENMLHQEAYGNSEAWYSDGPSASNRASKQIFMTGKHVAVPPYYAHYPESYPRARHEMGMHNSNPSTHIPDEMPRYRDYLGSHLPRRAPYQPPNQYQQQTSHPPYLHGLYVDADPDAFEPYAHNAPQHHHSCSCFHCLNKHRQVAPPIPPNNFGNPRFADVPNNSMFYNRTNSSALGPRVYNSRTLNAPPLTTYDPRPHTRWPNDLNYEMDDFVPQPPHRVVLASSGRRCRPVAGGAPFITCHNCFELLQLPKKVLIMEKSRQKMRCGACSTVIYYTVVDNKFLVSVDSEESTTPKENVDGLNEVGDGGTTLQPHPVVTRASASFYSDDFDSSGYEFQSMDKGAVLSTDGVNTNSNPTCVTQSLQSSSPTDSEDEDFQEGLPARREMDMSKKSIPSPPPPGSPLQEHFDYSSNNHAANRFGKGNRSSRTDHEKVMPKSVTSRQNSLKEVSMATEMEVSFNEYTNTISQDSGDASKEEDRPRINKGGVFAGIIKKSFRDFSRSNQAVDNGKANVTINEHPIPDRLIKKAEKRAGPIRPGQYWYDPRAGFWGVLGGPCFGIIPPFIEEFDYPIPENCSGGTTGVFVNGRELHKKDLDLLARRGLPTARDRSYIIEISGRVLDEHTGEELESLGRLAPTVEKAKHGFGMKVPRSMAA